MERGNDGNCNCGRAVVQRTSWTDLNPGRRYVSCENFRSPGGCNFFAWTDAPMCERSKHIIPGLLRKINNLEGEIEEAKRLKEIEEAERGKKRLPFAQLVFIVVIAIVCYILLW